MDFVGFHHHIYFILFYFFSVVHNSRVESFCKPKFGLVGKNMMIVYVLYQYFV
uniref:Uncharacterized protein n=1 Tax=Physcomitrium patens TaxID=3218 RepID=A0A2K1IEW2_PHYPA|nr:hypothetical protein PHYPA_029966 [Physcomitrium patens]